MSSYSFSPICHSNYVSSPIVFSEALADFLCFMSSHLIACYANGYRNLLLSLGCGLKDAFNKKEEEENELLDTSCDGPSCLMKESFTIMRVYYEMAPSMEVGRS